MTDCRRFQGHRAAKGAFQRHNPRASQRRAEEQLRRVQPWPTTKPAVAVPHDAARGAR